MGSTNFMLLEDKLPELAEAANAVELSVYADPAAAVAKARIFIEILIRKLDQKYNLNLPLKSSLAEIISSAKLAGIAPAQIISKIQKIRAVGNHCAHGGRVKTATALNILQEIYDLSRWAAGRYCKIKINAYPPYKAPEDTPNYHDEINQEQIALLKRKLKQLCCINTAYAGILAQMACIETKIKQHHTLSPAEQDIARLIFNTRPHMDYIFAHSKLKGFFNRLYHAFEKEKHQRRTKLPRNKFMHLHPVKFVAENRISTVNAVKKRFRHTLS